MNELTVLNYGDIQVVDSREVATMVGKRHKELLRDIRGYCNHLTESNFALSDFFVESIYQDSTGRELPCFLCTKKGCDMIANKMTGKKGTLFTAEYVTAFEKMQNFIKDGKQLSNAVPFPQLVESIDIVANSLKANDASKILMYHKLYECYGLPTEFLPNYELNGSRDLKPASQLLKEYGLEMSAIKFNEKMIGAGFLIKKCRNSSHGTVKYYNALTDGGLKYGENAISPYNQKETQPLYYSDSFKELFETVFLEKAQ